jgi:hypothetical protein
METRSEPPSNSATGGLRGELPNEAFLVPWHDEVTEKLGYAPRSMYVEMCWLPILGPTATWLYRRLGSWAEFNEGGVNVDMTDLAVSLGLGEGLGPHSKIGRAIERLTRFDAARWHTGELAVRTALPALPQRHLGRLSYSSRRLHEEFTRRPNGDIPRRSA